MCLKLVKTLDIEPCRRHHKGQHKFCRCRTGSVLIPIAAQVDPSTAAEAASSSHDAATALSAAHDQLYALAEAIAASPQV